MSNTSVVLILALVSLVQSTTGQTPSNGERSDPISQLEELRNVVVSQHEALQEYLQVMRQNINFQLLKQDKEITDIGQDISELKQSIDELKAETKKLQETCQGAPTKVAHNCQDVLDNGGTDSGVYTIMPVDLKYGTEPEELQVYCDQKTEGGGWLVFQRRKDGSENFYRGWSDYTEGFGNLDGEFWLGNKWLHELTSQGSMELRFDLGDFENEQRYAKYNSFSVAPESDKFRLHVGGYSGDAGDTLTAGRHNGMAFSTKDRDYSGNCATLYKGGWWYDSCHVANLNGLYLSGQHASYANGVNWMPWHGYHYSLKFTEMKMRPKGSTRC